MKGDIPKFKHAFEKLFQRSKFLNGKYYTFFGPGQLRDDRWIIPDIDPDTQEYLGYHVDKEWKYIKPTDWLAEKVPLFPPQVVRININVYGAYFNADAPFAFLIVGGVTWPDPSLIPYTFFYEPATTEHERILEIATNVKKKIEKIRKGRTWINIENFYEGSVERGGLCAPFYFDDSTSCNTIENPARLNAFNYGDLRNVGLFLDLPNLDLDFFGTDFLGIYFGDHIFTPINFGDNVLFGDFDSQPKWLAMQDVIPKTYKKYVKYSEILFPCDIGTDIFASSQQSVANIIAEFNGIGTVSDVFGYTTVDDLSQLPDNYISYYPLPNGEGYNVIISDTLTQQDYQATYHALPITPSVSNFTKVIQWAKEHKIDITSPGKTSTIGSEEELINLIANHYKFNPQTGKDK